MISYILFIKNPPHMWWVVRSVAGEPIPTAQAAIRIGAAFKIANFGI
jgi:hypothetical protein